MLRGENMDTNRSTGKCIQPYIIRTCCVLGLLFSSVFVCNAGEVESSDEDVTQFLALSLEELMQVQITSVSKRSEALLDAAAAVFVLSSEDIKRSGVTNLPDALRLVPGVNVAKLDGNKWAISIRGFNNRFADKLLVLIDGRSVYTPKYGGVHWSIHDMPLGDIERIEVVRGPGGTLWGSNTLNGVINIITKKVVILKVAS